MEGRVKGVNGLTHYPHPLARFTITAMLSFLVYEDGEPAAVRELSNAHLVGVDDVGVRGAIRFEDGRIIAEKNATGPAALALQFEVAGLGEFMLQTCLLPEREEPYILSVELARHRLMKLIAKQEDWAMFDVADDNPAKARFALAKEKFVEALDIVGDPAAADAVARESLAAAIEASEELSMTHAEVLLTRRSSAGTLSRFAFGCGVSLSQTPEQFGSALKESADYLRVSAPWRVLEPSEQDRQWQSLDRWCEWAVKVRLPVLTGPLVSFNTACVPDWLYVWEHDYDTVRDLLYGHIETMVARYKSVVSLWNVVSGIHVNSHFAFNFEQVMDLTRMAVLLTKKTHAGAKTLIEVCQPFGEYYAFNQRSIPPIMYAEMAVQAGIPFDAFGLRVVMGQAADGSWTRDLMQLSAMLDRFNGLGKPVHVTAVAVPSEPQAEADPDATQTVHAASGRSGYWRKPWSPQVQAAWLEKFYRVALSKPFVESVSWLEMADHDGLELPSSGLLNEHLQPKPSLKRLKALRKSLHEHA